MICKVSCDVYLVKFFIHIIFHALPYSLHSCHTGLFSSSYPGLYLLLGLYMHYSLVWNVVTLYFTCLACHSDLNWNFAFPVEDRNNLPSFSIMSLHLDSFCGIYHSWYDFPYLFICLLPVECKFHESRDLVCVVTLGSLASGIMPGS